MLLSHANLLFMFLPVCLAGPIDQPALGDVGTGSGETSGPGQFNGELDNAALTGNFVAATPGEDYSSSINLITDPALGALPESSSGVQQSAQDRSTLLSAAEQTDANPERATEFLIAQSREGVVPPAGWRRNTRTTCEAESKSGLGIAGLIQRIPSKCGCAKESMQDPATTTSTGYMTYYDQPAGWCVRGKFLKCCWEGLVRCFECELLTALGIITILPLDLISCSTSTNDQMYS